MKKQEYKWIIVAAFLVLFLFSNNKQTGQISTIEGGNWDISEIVNSKGYDIYLVEESDFDYTTPIVYNLAQSIKDSTSSPEDAIKTTAKIVAQRTRYSAAVTVSYCYNEKASTVAETMQGDCVSMSRLVVALLRAQGIPARTSGGCLSTKSRCSILFSTVPYLEAQYVSMTEGDFKKRGFLHEWVEAWEPSRGWVLIEATAGQVFPLDCKSYIQYSYDTNQYDRCVITDSGFWNQCKVS